MYDLSAGAIVNHFFPISSALEWFASTYFVVYAFIPFLKKATAYLREHASQYNILICFILFFESILGFVTPSNNLFSYLVMGFSIVFLGDWLNFRKNLLNKLPLKTVFLITLLLNICAVVFTIWFTDKFPIFEALRRHFVSDRCPFPIIMAACLVLIFSRMSFSSRVINFLAATTFSVYITHAGAYWREFLWEILLDVPSHLNSYVLYLLPSIIVVFSIGIVYDVIYKHVIIKILKKVFAKPCSRCDRILFDSGLLEI